MRRSLKGLVFLLTILLLGGCVSSTPVKKAPLDTARQQELRKKLIGTWEQTHRKPSEDASRQRLRVKIQKWSFNRDGSMTITAGSVNPMTNNKTTNSNQGSWYLEGRNLALGDPGQESVRFRVEKWSQDEMVWFNYNASNYYIVERVD